jgi:hypothetical protein
MSRNPFLSTFEAEFNKEAKRTDLIDMSQDMRASPKKDTFPTATEELFVRPPLTPARARVRPPSTSYTPHRLQFQRLCLLRI